ncbi:aminotransferase class V-fold PLP-dependent enzyme [Phytoactinopolyspora halotolerans]|uniref:Aminotransferase class V-fold PLP-dependent enzyme n=1 Tax=Phytoactinopolyspora halotolerans TaxID=1981512 RepID=A0A6L9SET3_9ACTN|nr:aminotransferase class V-fold PLP-dependent enzyme [Phytoactinopolyspora halotolerans]NEE03164.1 aminotransferase class V-fold PLP-dependent enzyme [Phytoactinopolyspora halotolerans]
MDIEAAQRLFTPDPGWLNTASYGLPPTPAWEALQTALHEWRCGRTSWKGWGEATGHARETFARLVNVPVSDVSIGAQVSQMLAVIASSMPEGTQVVVPEEEFTSNLFPWLVQQRRGLDVRPVPAADLANVVTAETGVIAFSLVQSATGAVADVDAITAAAAEAGAVTVADATQACGWLPVDASRYDATVVGAYKWLLSPRGTAFLVTKPELRSTLVPSQAGWWAGEDPHASYYGPPLRLADDARSLDISPAWFSWVGTAPALELVEQVGIDSIHAHDVALANRFRAGLGMDAGDSAIVSADVPDAERRLEAAGVRAAVRGGRLRASFHLYNTSDDVDMALDALTADTTPA